MPAWVADKKTRAAKIRAAKAELEAEAKAAAEAKAKEQVEAEEKRKAEGRKKPGKPAAPPSPEPEAKAQKNFTDPESRIMKSKDGFVQAYNGQIAVDARAQIIVAQDVTQCAADSGQLLPMVDAVEANLGRKPEQASADSGYCSEANLEGMEQRNVDAYVATGRAKHAVAGKAKDAGAAITADAAAAPTQETDAPTRVEAMRLKIKSGGYAIGTIWIVRVLVAIEIFLELLIEMARRRLGEDDDSDGGRLASAPASGGIPQQGGRSPRMGWRDILRV